MTRLLLLVAALIGLGAPAAAAGPVASVTISRAGETWHADYRLGAAAPAWLFARSPLARVGPPEWRKATWTVLTPGVKLVRAGHYDALVAERGMVPRNVRIRFTPFSDDIETGYDAALAFSDGSVALFDQQFKLIPMPSLAAVADAPFDAERIAGVDRRTRTIFRDRGGPVLAMGRRVSQAVLEDSGTYVLFGPARPSFSPALTTIVDRELPAWLSAYLTREMPRILGEYARRMGPAPGGTPTLMVSWAGPQEGATSMSGSVLPGLVVMTFLGDGVVNESQGVRNFTRGFVAHEAAHFWLGQAIEADGVRNNWISEGGADLLGIRAIAATDSKFDVAARVGRLRQDCAAHLAKGPLATATERGDSKAPYNCGALISMVAEQAYGGDFGAFVRALIAANRGDRLVTRAEWIAAVEARRPGRGLGRLIDSLVDDPQPDPNAALDRLIAAGGIGAALPPPAK